MLKEILSPKTCADCRNCCVFQEESRWEAPVVDEERARLIRERETGESWLTATGTGSHTLNTVLREKELAPGEEPYRCIALDESSGCTLSPEEKPFDCSLWPIRVMEREGRIFLTLAGGCRGVSDTFIKKENKLLLKSLKEQVVKKLKENPDVIKPYSEDYAVLCELEEL